MTARLSCFSYLVALMPYAVVRDLELDVELRSRPVASYTPVLRGGRADGMLVERKPGTATVESFRRVTGSDHDWRAWQRFYDQIGKAARVIAPVWRRRRKSACGSPTMTPGRIFLARFWSSISSPIWGRDA